MNPKQALDNELLELNDEQTPLQALRDTDKYKYYGTIYFTLPIMQILIISGILFLLCCLFEFLTGTVLNISSMQFSNFSLILSLVTYVIWMIKTKNY